MHRPLVVRLGSVPIRNSHRGLCIESEARVRDTFGNVA
jgi:hypothetical protein